LLNHAGKIIFFFTAVAFFSITTTLLNTPYSKNLALQSPRNRSPLFHPAPIVMRVARPTRLKHAVQRDHPLQDSQFSSYDWQEFLKAHNLQPGMSRRGNCHDNAVAESFFQLLKRERVRRKIYLTRNLAKQDVFEYTVMFYNPKRRHSLSAGMSPVEYEK
jgi:hypothetical protein